VGRYSRLRHTDDAHRNQMPSPVHRQSSSGERPLYTLRLKFKSARPLTAEIMSLYCICMGLSGYAEKITSTLSRAEAEVRVLIREAAEAADYGAVADLAGIARAISNIGAPLLSERPSLKDDAVRPASRYERAKKSAHYPYFLRDESVLVKVGWSRTGRTEYEHKAPKSVLDSLVTKIEGRPSRTGARFTTDKLFPLSESDGTVVPDYQSYLCLAWLCSTGLIERDGRQGYRVLASPLKEVTEDRWFSLETRE
jgi:hypothetical protein